MSGDEVFALWWPRVCAKALFAVLKTASSFDVRDDGLRGARATELRDGASKTGIGG